MIASNIARNMMVSEMGRFHRNKLAIPEERPEDEEFNPYKMMTRSRRQSGEVHLLESPPPAPPTRTRRSSKLFTATSNPTLKSRNFKCYGDMKKDTTKQLRKMNSTAANRIASPTVIKSNPVFQYANDENVSQLVSGKPRSREEDLKIAILELAQLGEHYVGKRKAPKMKNKKVDGPVVKIPNLRVLHKKTRTRRSGSALAVKSPLSSKEVKHYMKELNAQDVHY
ncbi:uncharacterized protein [Dysidea avara]|uniref:uncharacterized protein n=1 Tax=Dysidea avara TaxID=196820 RepID=UPI00331B5D0C